MANRALVIPADPVLDLSAVEIARRIAAAMLDAEEVVEHCLARVDALNGEVSAFVHVDREGAIHEARKKDRARAPGARLPPFHGVPIGVKDLNLVRGMPARFGSRAFERFVSMIDDDMVKQLRAAGFVILGKTSTSELGAMPVVEPLIHPPTRNPRDLDRTAGGSSGGSASAVAAGLVPIAQASDGAGSIRIPASFCGLVGIKPSRGRVHDPYRPAKAGSGKVIYAMGPIGRSVRDVAAMLDAMAGHGVGTRASAPPANVFYAEAIDRPLPKLRVRLCVRSPFVDTRPEIAEASKKAADRLAAMGHHVDEAKGFVDAKIEEFLPVWQHTTANAPVHDWSLVQETTRWLAEHGRKVEAKDVARAQASLEARVLAWFGDVDVLLTPTVGIPPPAIGAWSKMRPEDAFAEAAQLGAFTAPFNVSGQPAATIPMGTSRDGLPIGVQIVGRPYAEDVVLAVAKLLES